MTVQILLSIVAAAVVGWMVWDQSRLKRMTPQKWALVPILLACTIGPVWM